MSAFRDCMSCAGFLLVMTCFGPRAFAQSAADQEPSSGLLGLSKHLRIEPKTTSRSNGDESTVGFEYEYSRRFADPSQRGNVDLYFESKGFIAADAADSPEKQLEHKFRFHLVDLAGGKRADDYETYRDPVSGENYRRKQAFDLIHQDPLMTAIRSKYRDYRTADSAEEEDRLLGEIEDMWPASRGRLTLDRHGRLIELEQIEEEWSWSQNEYEQGVSSAWLSFELNAGAESDQDFGNVQYVGGARLYGKWGLLGTPLNYLCEALRGYERPTNFQNVEGGPYFWAGVDMVDASKNEARRAVTGRMDETFGRFTGGAYYRNELFNYGTADEPEAVSLEVTWEYYAELDAPDSIRSSGTDTTSFLAASLLFEGGMFLEYKDGAKPLDVRDSTAVSLGWRFGR